MFLFTKYILMELCNFLLGKIIINISLLKYMHFYEDKIMKYSDAQKEATARYNKKTYERIDVVVKKGQRQIIKDFAASQGKSLNRFILDAVEKEINAIKNNE